MSSGRINIRVDSSINKRLSALPRSVNFSAFVRVAVDQLLDRLEKNPDLDYSKVRVGVLEQQELVFEGRNKVSRSKNHG